jgi:hypothetical protein
MQKSPESVNRKMIPRWRTLAYTPSAEFVSTGQKARVRVLAGIDDVRAEWIAERTPWAAAEVLSMAVYTGRDGVADDAAAYLSCMIPELSAGVRNVLRSYLREDPETEDDGTLSGEKEVRFGAIAELKGLIALHPQNPIPYVEVARLYVSLGQMGAARRALSRALILAPGDR